MTAMPSPGMKRTSSDVRSAQHGWREAIPIVCHRREDVGFREGSTRRMTKLLRRGRKHKWMPRLRQNNPPGKSPKVCPALAQKIFRLSRRANQRYQLAPSHPDEGRLAIVTNVAVRCGGRDAREGRACVKRTAKSCGPDAPTLASSGAEGSARRRWQESPVTGESAK
jgi:hypothetical protein